MPITASWGTKASWNCVKHLNGSLPLCLLSSKIADLTKFFFNSSCPTSGQRVRRGLGNQIFLVPMAPAGNYPRWGTKSQDLVFCGVLCSKSLEQWDRSLGLWLGVASQGLLRTGHTCSQQGWQTAWVCPPRLRKTRAYPKKAEEGWWGWGEQAWRMTSWKSLSFRVPWPSLRYF